MFPSVVWLVVTCNLWSLAVNHSLTYLAFHSHKKRTGYGLSVSYDYGLFINDLVKCFFLIQELIFLFESVFHWRFFITYIFSVSLKFRVCYTMDKWGEFTVKNATLFLHMLSWHFLLFFIQKSFCFYHFHFFFWWSIEFLQQIINQSETGIGD